VSWTAGFRADAMQFSSFAPYLECNCGVTQASILVITVAPSLCRMAAAVSSLPLCSRYSRC